ncbi:uncharacterized protein LOC110477604 isoform X1 [Lonchura striata]
MRLSLKAFAFSRREKKLPKNGKEEIYHIICLSTGFPLGLWRFPRGNYFPLTQTTGQCEHVTNIFLSSSQVFSTYQNFTCMGPVLEKVPGAVSCIGLTKDSSVQGWKGTAVKS